jgi:hypothetical protein
LRFFVRPDVVCSLTERESSNCSGQFQTSGQRRFRIAVAPIARSTAGSGIQKFVADSVSGISPVSVFAVNGLFAIGLHE